MAVNVNIGGEMKTFANSKDAMEAQNAYIAGLEARLKAAEEAKQATVREFSMELARYSSAVNEDGTSKYGTPKALIGALKGEVKIVSEKIPFGVTLTPKTWFELQDHAEQITKFMEENRKVLAEAEKFAKETKAANKSRK